MGIPLLREITAAYVLRRFRKIAKSDC